MAYPLAMEKHIQEWLESLMQGERKLLFSWAIMEHLIVEPAAAAAPTQRQQRPSGSNDPAARKWRCSEPAAAANQRRQRPSDGNDPAAATNQRTIDGGRVGCREREERHGDCGGEGEKEKKGWLGCREREERNGVV
ncbi:hypothetical protein DEO72_LG1g3192 [Vigna unguiculata]|uniref:Uncharacterized protein n=1 Tax=Vigna unguiculata TaxID=3917 RepID=A0A4D6KS74_VIGUN|nr:hypothetical protein DEO72_LG1g3192 [Vigna unguiculata]